MGEIKSPQGLKIIDADGNQILDIEHFEMRGMYYEIAV